MFVLKKDGCIKFTDEKEFLKRLVEDKSHNWTIGTSSLRRIAQLKHLQPNIQVADIRGNIDTRLKKLDDLQSDYAALVLAAAGLKRAGFGDRINVSLRNNWWHAVGQGAIALECRENDEFIHNLLYPLIHFKTTYEIIAERSFMQYLEGGCSVPLGVKCWFGPTDQQLTTYSNQSSTEPVEREKSVLLPVNGDSNSIKNGKRSLMDDASESIHETHEHIKKIRVDGDSLCPETVCNGNSPESNGSVAKAGVCPVLTAKRVMEHLFDNSRTLIDQQEYESSDLFDCNNISNLSLSGVVYSPDGKRHVRFESSLDEAIRHFDQLPDDQKPKVNCSHVSFPTRACPKLQQVRIDYEHCAQLGVFVAQKLIELGAQGILDELKAVRIPLEAGAEDVSI